MNIDINTLHKFEIDKVLTDISKYTFNSTTIDRIININNNLKYQEILNQQTIINDISNILKNNLDFDFNINLNSLIESYNLIKNNSEISINNIVVFYDFYNNIKNLINYFKDKRINNLFTNLIDTMYIDHSFIDLFNKTFTDKSYQIKKNATPELAKIYDSINSLKNILRINLNKYLSDEKYKNILQSNNFTIRNNRYVLIIKNDFKGKINGISIDYSSTNNTVYLEPIECIDTNNRLNEYLFKEKIEINKILSKFIYKISSNIEKIDYTLDTLKQIDFYLTISKYFYNNNYICPKLNFKHELIANGIFHPLIKNCIRNDILLESNKHILVVSGANSAGKSIFLKTIALIVYFANIGFYVPAEFADIPLLESLYCEIGDNQGININLSTFSSHIKNLSKILSSNLNNSLILIDELCDGTSPYEGEALACSVLEHLNSNKNLLAIITTHYDKIKSFAYNTNSLFNASMEYDLENNAPTFKLLYGKYGNSYGLQIAKNYGISEEIIKNSSKFLDKDYLNIKDLLNKIDNENIEIHNKKELINDYLQKIEKTYKQINELYNFIQNKKEHLNEYISRKKTEIIDEYVEKATSIIEKIKKYETDLNIFEMYRLRNEINNLDESNNFINNDNIKIEELNIDKDIKINDKVKIKSINQIGIVVKIKNSYYYVKTDNNIDIKTVKDDLIIVTKQPVNKKVNKIIHKNNNINIEPIKYEVNIIGKKYDEAKLEIINFLDQAIINNVKEIKIIHGFGKGVLKDLVNKLLKENPNVTNIRPGNYYEGGQGVTFASIK